MSDYLFRLLLRSGDVPRPMLVRALGRSLVRKTSLAEALVSLDLRLARILEDRVRSQGELADPSWRPASSLLMELPPGLCERSLSFPFRERAGKVEVVTLCPADDWTRQEFEAHLGRPVVLYRASLQALLAAAHSAVDLPALRRHLAASEAPEEDGALPLVRKSRDKPAKKERTPTSPGLGNRGVTRPVASLPGDQLSRAPSSKRLSMDRPSNPALGEVSIQTQSLRPEVTARPPTWTSPVKATAALYLEARDARELCLALSAQLPAPALFFELSEGRLSLVVATGAGTYSDVRVSLVQVSALSTAVEEGSYLGPFYECPTHAHFFSTFAVDTLVRIERIGSLERGVIVVTAGQFDVERAGEILNAAAGAWERIAERDESPSNR